MSSVVDSNTDSHLIDQGKVGYLYHLQILLFNLQAASSSSSSSLLTNTLILRQYNNNDLTGNNNGLFGRDQQDTNILLSRRLKLLSYSTCTTSNIVQAVVPMIFISLINTPFRIIDHGSVVYLVLLQIRFYDQQDSLLLLENNSTLLKNNNTMYLILQISVYDQHDSLLLL